MKEFLIFLGGALGALVLDFEERLMAVLGQPSDKPVLRNVLCQVVLLSLAFYIGTSTVSLTKSDSVGDQSLLPLSFVLGFLVRSLVEQYLEVRGIQDLGSWFWFVKGKLDLQIQKIYLVILGVLVFFLSLTLVRG